jgi:hypothetical protein
MEIFNFYHFIDELGEGAQGKVKIAERDCLATVLS